MMCLTDFEHGAQTLCQVLQEESGGGALLQWSIEPSSVDESIYLQHPPVYSSQKADATIHDSAAMEESLVEDPDVIYEHLPDWEWRFTIVYSETWNVPVLYFQVFQNKMLCSRDHVLTVLKENVHDTWEFVSYEEHPATGVPSLFLHPCRTQERMKCLFNESDSSPAKQLWSWMSLILPTVGFSIPSPIYQRVWQRLQQQVEFA
jgi:hypothetical protein